MKHTTLKKQTANYFLVVAALMLSSAATQAAIYTLDINTAELASNPGYGSYYLDFQFASGSGAVGNNTISLGGFTFTGGSATGSASLFGSASGNLSSGATLIDSTTPSEIYQQFTSGTTDIRFNVNTTLNLDAGLTPDMFSVAILDSSLGFPAQIYTTSPDTLSLFTETISSSTTANLAAYAGVGPADGSASGLFSGVTATVVPEPSAFSLCAAGVASLLAWRFRPAILRK